MDRSSQRISRRLSEAVHLRLSEADRFNIRVISHHLAATNQYVGSLSLSSAVRWALHEIAQQILDKKGLQHG